MTNAYFTSNNEYDAIVIPSTGVAFLGFTNEDLSVFLTGQNPDFANWTGDNSFDFAQTEEEEFDIAQTFGTIVAQRVSGSSEARFLALGAKHDELLALM